MSRNAPNQDELPAWLVALVTRVWRVFRRFVGGWRGAPRARAIGAAARPATRGDGRSGGRRAAIAPTAEQAARIVRRIAPELDRYADRYEEGKYPPQVLEQLRRRFRRPAEVTSADIEAALVWKYGHTGKEDYPEHHKRLMADVATVWPDAAPRPGESATDALLRWASDVRRPGGARVQIVTVAFLLHLCFPDELPILDQHNFRAVRRHLSAVDGAWSWPRTVPTQVDDVLLVAQFMSGVRGAWAGSPAPDRDRLDRYLMMRGKAWKGETTG